MPSVPEHRRQPDRHPVAKLSATAVRAKLVAG
jgi:hypothetical protein